jgi:hypothetical protein
MPGGSYLRHCVVARQPGLFSAPIRALHRSIAALTCDTLPRDARLCPMLPEAVLASSLRCSCSRTEECTFSTGCR